MDDDEPSEMDESEEEIEEIVTEGARGLQAAAAGPASSLTAAVAVPPTSAAAGPLLQTENKVLDHHVQIMDGRAVAGMYQVVHRVETISTTTAVVPEHAEKQVGRPGTPSSQGPLSNAVATTLGGRCTRTEGKGH